VKRAIKSGEIRSDLDPLDLLRALIGVSNVASEPDWPQSAKRLVEILILGSRPIGESARIVGQLRRDIVVKYPAGWYDRDIFRSAHALNALGVGPGDTIACIGTRACLYDHYWARLARVRILDAPLYPALAAESNRDQAYEALRREGAKALIGYFEPGTMNTADPVAAGWRELDETPFYAFPLNLPAVPPPSERNDARP